MKKIQLLTLVVFLMAFLSVPEFVAAEKRQAGLKLGVMTCDSLPGTKTQIFLRTAVRVKCTFKTNKGEEKYKGEFGLLGVDLSKKSAEKMQFVVFGLSDDIKLGAHTLRGDYNGVQATIGVGVGGGPNHLLGGWKDSFTLAPSIETHKGIGVTLGGTRLNLEPEK